MGEHGPHEPGETLAGVPLPWRWDESHRATATSCRAVCAVTGVYAQDRGLRCTVRAMSCPTCKGTERTPLAYGYWRCQSKVTDTYTVPVPAPGLPLSLGIMAPWVQQVVRECGTEYHDFSSMEDDMLYCFCSTGAIGRCADDGRMVCGFHSDLRENRRLCSECLIKFDDGARKAALAANKAALAAKLEPVERLADAMCRLQDPSHIFLLYLLLIGGMPNVIGTRSATTMGTTDLPYEESRDLIRSRVEPRLSASSLDLHDISGASARDWSFDLPALLQQWSKSGLLLAGTLLTHARYTLGLFGISSKRVVIGEMEGWEIGFDNEKKIYKYLLANGSVALGYNQQDIRDVRPNSLIGYSIVKRLVDKKYLQLPALDRSEGKLLREMIEVS